MTAHLACIKCVPSVTLQAGKAFCTSYLCRCKRCGRWQAFKP